jgi:hypothetical protein
MSYLSSSGDYVIEDGPNNAYPVQVRNRVTGRFVGEFSKLDDALRFVAHVMQIRVGLHAFTPKKA